MLRPHSCCWSCIFEVAEQGWRGERSVPPRAADAGTSYWKLEKGVRVAAAVLLLPGAAGGGRRHVGVLGPRLPRDEPRPRAQGWTQDPLLPALSLGCVVLGDAPQQLSPLPQVGWG